MKFQFLPEEASFGISTNIIFAETPLAVSTSRILNSAKFEFLRYICLTSSIMHVVSILFSGYEALQETQKPKVSCSGPKS